MSRKSVLERAFELALAAPVSSIGEIRTALKAERYTDAVAQTSYPTIRKQLRAAMQKRLAGEALHCPHEADDREIKLKSLTSCLN